MEQDIADGFLTVLEKGIVLRKVAIAFAVFIPFLIMCKAASFGDGCPTAVILPFFAAITFAFLIPLSIGIFKLDGQL